MIWSVVGNVYMVVVVSMIIVVSGVRSMGYVGVVAGLLMLLEHGESMVWMDKMGDSGMERVLKGLVVCVGGVMLVGEKRREFKVLVVLMVFGGVVAIMSKEWMGIYLGLEIQAMASYVVVAYRKGSSYSMKSGVTYFIMGAIGSGLILMGVVEAYGRTGSMVVEEMKIMGEAVNRIMVCGVAVKLGMGPVNGWYIRMLEGVESRAAMVVSLVPKITLLGLLVKVGAGMEEMWVFTVVSMVVGVVGGWYQRDMKRFMGYSTVGQLGYMVAGCEEVEAMVDYIIVYVVVGIAVWMVVEKYRIKYVEDLRGVCGRNEILGMTVVGLVLALSGLPPVLGGLMVKIGIVKGLVCGEYWVVVGVMLMCTVVGVFNYVRWIKGMYYEGEVVGGRVEKSVVRMGKVEGIMMGLIVWGVAGYGIV